MRYRPSRVWYVLQRLGWSCQEPQRRTFARDDEAVVHWKHYVWPQLEKVASAGCHLGFIVDESGFSLVCHLKRAWAPRGQTPTMRTNIQHHERLNVLGAVCVSPAKRQIKLPIQSDWHAINGDAVTAFLERLVQHIAGPIVLLWDMHPNHRRPTVEDVLACHPRIHTFEFPTAAPELNPTEGVRTQVSESAASIAAHNGTELQENGRRHRSHTPFTQSTVGACRRL